jgi:hypothetical protein
MSDTATGVITPPTTDASGNASWGTDPSLTALPNAGTETLAQQEAQA